MPIKLRTKELREERGLSQLELGLELDIGNTSIQQYEAGLHEPSFSTLIKIADYFDVTVDYLIGRTPIRNTLHSNDEKLAYQLNHLDNEKAKQAALALLEEVRTGNN